MMLVMMFLSSDHSEGFAGRAGKVRTVTGETEDGSRELQEGDAGQLTGGRSTSQEEFRDGGACCRMALVSAIMRLYSIFN